MDVLAQVAILIIELVVYCVLSIARLATELFLLVSRRNDAKRKAARDADRRARGATPPH